MTSSTPTPPQPADATPASAHVETLDDVLARVAARRGIDFALLKAHAIVESALKADAVRWNPPRDVSVGVLQVLCIPPDGATPDENYVCQNKFNVEGWPVSFNQLKDAETCADIAAQIIAYNLRTFGYPRGIAVYNNWNARLANIEGPFPNQSYVNHVLRELDKLKGNENA